MLLKEVLLIAFTGTNFNTGVVIVQSELHRIFRTTGDEEHKPFRQQGETVHNKIKKIFPGLVICLN